LENSSIAELISQEVFMSTENVPQYSADPWIYRMIVGVLGLVMLAVVIGGLLSVKDMPQGILAIGSAAVGGLVGLLVPSPVSRSNLPVPPA